MLFKDLPPSFISPEGLQGSTFSHVGTNLPWTPQTYSPVGKLDPKVACSPNKPPHISPSA